MNRVKTLIEKLQEQLQNGASPSAMLATSRMLESELAFLMGKESTESSGKVSIILPVTHVAHNAEAKTPSSSKKEEKIIEVLQVNEEEIEKELDEIKKHAEEMKTVKQHSYSGMDESFDPIEDVPTLAQQTLFSEPLADLPEKIEFPKAEETELSLNDKLKERRVELSESLNSSPIKDLRKAIEINDRFLFINELFRGDEIMFDRSIKTIQGFKIFAEAEFWIRRELKLKLGWRNNDPLVKRFDELIRRRFS